ncbi:hypothetical protein AHS86_05725 [Salmonella enterica subsp. enterica]|nr:hypothetical protein [Salmonella enterica subsp. enterica]EAO9151760.1 hypothetical protein [Salmonella enterica]ECH9148032.1 hypothetical protein [Salmonella enterica subsp. enterica]
MPPSTTHSIIVAVAITTGGALPLFGFTDKTDSENIRNAPSCCARLYLTTSGLRWSRLYPYSENLC